MVEIRAHELGFDVEEAGTLLRAELGFELNREEVEVLLKRTESLCEKVG
jgi:ATP/maltotriose-dependent transcriptional regulator MalT